MRGCETPDRSRPFRVLAAEFASSSIDFDVIWWCSADPLEQRESRAEVISSIKSALDHAGIEIPFPYRTLTFKQPLAVTQDSSVEHV